tara:strand:+ start:16690 stop:18183 length:1494 start_codon:yes stop_codon:yes gene_type:complete
MAWKKIIVSGSSAELGALTTTGHITSSANIKGANFIGNGDSLTFASKTVVSQSAQIDIHNTTGYEANENIDHTSVTVTAGTGLTGGGTIAATRTLNVESANNGIVANADNIELATASSTFTGGVTAVNHAANIISGAAQISALGFLDGAGDGIMSGSAQVVASLLNQATNFGNKPVSASAFKGDGSGLTGLTVAQSATVITDFTSQTSVATTHNFGTKNVMATVYDNNDAQIIPASVVTTNDNVVTVTFDSSTTGRVIIGKGGHVVSGSIPYANLIAVPANIISSSAQTKTFLPAGVVSSSIQLPSGIVSSSTQLPSGILSSSAQVQAIGTFVSSSVLTSPSQGVIRVVSNGVTTNANTGLQAADGPSFAGLTLTGAAAGTSLTLSGDLVVNGDTTTVNSTNLLVKDKYILLSSGSTSAGPGGLVIDEGSRKGHAFVYNNSSVRFGFTSSLAHNATSATPDAFASAVVDLDAGHTDVPQYQKNGNIKTDSGVIWIYS